MEWEMSDVEDACFKKGWRMGNNIADELEIIEKAKEHQKEVIMWFFDYSKTLSSVHM